ncbi:cytochrome P450 [Rhodococcus sp. ACS1]|uniref:cytochrome P450 n=1 Tax=Rhodococcus sp. ACS1 TaxID=2028570 RepID=UPI000BB0F6BD|nr:cytochrome P450 [Rhodococcus sp. ACS1]PBC39481.1 cytochrome P450 [Rhodococcus sp. ACS1]
MTTTDFPNSMTEHFDIFDPVHEDSKYQFFSYARKGCPVPHTDAHGGFWLITRFEDARTVLQDWQTFSSVESPPLPSPVSMCPIDSDPPIQAHARRLLSPYLSPKFLSRFEPRMREHASALIDNWIGNGEVELMTEFAGPYVAKVLAEVVFSDLTAEELDEARRISMRATEESTPDVWMDLHQMCAKYLDKARNNPDQPDGIIKAITTGDFGDRPPTEDEQLGMLGILFLGGLDTTRSAIGGIAYRVALEPDVEERLRDPEWVRRDLDEFLRLDSPVGCMARVATRDTEVNGVTIKAGERVLVRFDSANRDEEHFDRADELVLDEIRGGHMAFGLGVHRCLGSNLARLQIGIAYEELLGRIENLGLAPESEISWVPGIGNSLRSLHLNFDKK